MQWHVRGEELRQQGNWEEAAAAYREAIALYSEFSWSHHNLGDVLRELEDWSGAVEAYRKAIELKSDFIWSYISLGEMLGTLELWEEAAQAYQKAININPNSSQALSKLADSLKICGESTLQRASEFYQQGACLKEANEETLRKALNANPSATGLYRRLAQLLIKQNRLDEAIFVYQTARQIAPQDLDLLLECSEIFEKQENLDELNNCLREIQRLISVEPNSASNYYALGNILYALKKWDDALLAYQKSASINPEYFDIYMQLGLTAFQLGHYEDSARFCREVIRLNPASSKAYKLLRSSANKLDDSVSRKYLDGLSTNSSGHVYDSVQLNNMHLKGRCVIGNIVAHPTAKQPFGLSAVLQVNDARYSLEIKFHQKFSLDTYSAKTCTFRVTVPLEIMTDSNVGEVNVIIFDSQHKVVYQANFNKQLFSQPYGMLESFSGTKIWGWAWDPSRPNTPIGVEIRGKENFQCRVQANRYRGDLREAGLGDGCHMFEITLSHEVQKELIQEMLVDGKYPIEISNLKKNDDIQITDRNPKISTRPSRRITLR